MATAVGIPNRAVYGDISQIRDNNIYDFVVQHHEAKRAGPHFDLRFGDENIGLLSWAIPSARLPAPGEKVLAVQQPLHAYSYKDFEGSIEKGYGAGSVKPYKQGRIIILRSEPNKIVFSIISERHPQRYALLRVQDGVKDDRNWLLLNITPKTPLVYEKQSFRIMDPDKFVEMLQSKPFAQVQPKIDGAHGLLTVDKDGKLELYSYRISRKGNLPIVHTERVFHGQPKLRVPSWLQDTVLMGEIYAIYKDGTVVPPNVLSSILNSAPYNSFARMAKDSIIPRFAVFDVARYGAETLSYDVPYEKRYALAKEAVKHLDHPQIHMIEGEKDISKALELWKQIISGKHPLTVEGVVVYPQTGVPYKVKTFKETDVFIRDIVPGKGKYARAAGGFQFSRDEHGPIVGVVGTGFDDEMRHDMWRNKEEYIGRRARVKYQEEFPSGALRAPVFVALHEDYPLAIEKKAGCAFMAEDDPRWMQVFDNLQAHYTLERYTKTASIMDMPILESVNQISTGLQQLLGGPNPLTSALLHAGIGLGLGLLAKSLLDYFIPRRPNQSLPRWRRYLPLLSTLAFVTPPVLMHVLPSLRQHGWGGIFKPTPLQKALLEAAQQKPSDQSVPQVELPNWFEEPNQEEILWHLFKYSADYTNRVAEGLAKTHGVEIIDDLPEDLGAIFLKKAENILDAKQWVNNLRSSTVLNPWEKAILGGMIYNVHLKTGKDKISIKDLAQQAKQIGLDYFHGDALGQVMLAIDRLPQQQRSYVMENGIACQCVKKIAAMIRDSVKLAIVYG